MASLRAAGLAVVSVFVLLQSASAHDTVCTYTHNQTCVDAVKDLILDRSLFWFGFDYVTDCPGGPTSSRACRNFRSNHNDSLLSRMMGRDDVTSESILFVVNVTYELPAERFFMGCGAMVNRSTQEPTVKKIDPMSGHSVRPFDASMEPKVTWPAVQGVTYAVVYYDVGYAILHGIYLNIQGGDIALGEVAFSHRGPKNTIPRKNPYVWSVFEQQGNLSVNEVKAYVESQRSSMTFLLAPFLERFNLTGPLGVNTVRAVADEYAAVYMRTMMISNTCPGYNQERIQKMVNDLGGLTFNLTLHPATISIDLQFVSNEMSFTSCCKKHMAGSVNRKVNYNNMPEVMTAQIRDRPSVQFVPNPPSLSLDGHFFTLMIVDPSPEFGTTTPNSVLHWLVVNIPASNVTSGDEILSYVPLVPGMRQRMYLALLYQQTTGSNEDIKNITGLSGMDCPSELMHRCKFHVSDFVRMNNLMLNGVREVKVKPDDYSRFRNVKDKKMTEREVCSGREGYAKPCPTSTGPVFRSRDVTTLGLIALLFSCLHRLQLW